MTEGRGFRRHALRHIVLGIRNSYPPCCVVRFVIESVLRPNVMQGVKRGVIHRPDRDSVYVPCGVFHHDETMDDGTDGDSDNIHVLPLNDLIEHPDDDCPCGPTIEPVEREDGSMGWVITHHSLDGRELNHP